MSDTKLQDGVSATSVSPESLQQVGGGGCTAADIVTITTGLTAAYEALIDFTAHVMERVIPY
jgi:hypothetical protein